MGVENKFEIISGYQNTKEYVEMVRQSGDANKSSLGFLPFGVYEEFAKKDQLFVVVENIGPKRIFAGYLLFDIRYPRASVIQMFSCPEYRRHGLASMLIKNLISVLTDKGFISLYARVADDLKESNIFWAKHHFYVQRVENGGAVRKRKILVRCHELQTLQLFPVSGISDDNPLGLSIPTSGVIPLYLLDLNVLFDQVGPRRVRHQDALGLFQAEKLDLCRLAISDEILDELTRNAPKEKTDPMAEYAKIFPMFPVPRDGELKPLVDGLSKIVFPGKERLSVNDKSDIKHLATAIQHNLEGLITSDDAILASSLALKKEYNIEVVSPDWFRVDGASIRSNDDFESIHDSTLALLDLGVEDRHKVHKFLTAIGLSGSRIASTWMPSGVQSATAINRVVLSGDRLIGYSTWMAGGTDSSLSARIAVDESSKDAAGAARILLTYLLEHLPHDIPRQVSVEFPEHQSRVRELAIGFGFRGTADKNTLTKVMLGSVITGSNWAVCQAALASKLGLKLPAEMPIFTGPDQMIEVLTPNGNRTFHSLDDLESLLCPTLFCLRGRSAVITPIQGAFSDALLGHSKQASLLPRNTASLFRERHYISGKNGLKYFKRGTFVLFYESLKGGGNKEVVAIARVRRAYLQPFDKLKRAELEQSVLREDSLMKIGSSETKTVMVFDNIFAFPAPVPLEFLRKIGCGRGTDLITTRPITDLQLQEILNEAFRSV